MPRISTREGSQAFKATSSLIQAPFLTFLLTGFYYPSTPHRDHDSSHLRTCHKHHRPSTGSIERYFFSALAQAGSCRLWCSPRSPNIIFYRDTRGVSSRGSQRRWLSACRATRNESADKAAKAVNSPKSSETALSSEEKPISSQIKQGDELQTGSDENNPFFKPFYEELEHGKGSTSLDANTINSQSTKRDDVKMQSPLRVLEEKTGEPMTDSNTFDELQNLIRSRI